MTTATMNPTTTTNTTTNENGVNYGTKIAFESITNPGCYVCNDTGHLFRVYNGFEADTWNEWFEVAGNEPFWFTYISDDPNCSIEDVRTNATNYGVNCSF